MSGWIDGVYALCKATHYCVLATASMFLCVYVCVYVCLYAFMCVCMHLCVCMYACMRVYVCMHACVCSKAGPPGDPWRERDANHGLRNTSVYRPRFLEVHVEAPAVVVVKG